MAKIMMKLFIALSITCTSAFATERIGRLGVGVSNQLKNDLTSLSFKIQKSRSFAFGGLLNIDTSDTGGWGAGLKFYKNVFEEPQANFYFSFLGALTNRKLSNGNEESGFQIDLTGGSEFSFTGLQSIGVSFETGISFNKMDEFAVQTTGSAFIFGSIHFYL
ncbi:hypothetical protein M899_2091 [Bacteriovorax sp. BSW11_IV]|uniref:hypothetical protein n=1 Tax=Bacteriovorax sp. BSW11_IV TaxID=1353529 RepID=UPI00038A4CA9|nr:hypothetical protein [Bacteriovorax sp. BSW11_IV]EQC48989.1 hypothetical protein M899_2091 [Bacteriovorax sp. BSW11_IV]